MLQEYHHMTEGQVVPAVCEGTELIGQYGKKRKWVRQAACSENRYNIQIVSTFLI